MGDFLLGDSQKPLKSKIVNRQSYINLFKENTNVRSFSKAFRQAYYKL